MGYKNDVNAYHAWNEVYLKDTNEWVTIDTSYDAVKKENGLNYTMIKDNTEYKAEKMY
jgi:transglutaminase-like putative cysteine protease